jgi:hypothetical protein
MEATYDMFINCFQLISISSPELLIKQLIQKFWWLMIPLVPQFLTKFSKRDGDSKSHLQ